MTDPTIPDWLRGIENTPISSPLLIALNKLNEIDLRTDDFDKFLDLLPSAIRKELEGIDTIQKFIEFILTEGISLKQIVNHLNWKHFEELTAAVFSFSGYDTICNFYFVPLSDNKRLEFDVICESKESRDVFLVDCKRYKTPSQAPIRKAADMQKERALQFLHAISMIHSDTRLSFPKWDRYVLIPIIVTWRDHSIKFHDNVPIVSIANLIDFIVNFPEYRDFCYKIVQDW